jgi:hypothetical protein
VCGECQCKPDHYGQYCDICQDCGPLNCTLYVDCVTCVYEKYDKVSIPGYEFGFLRRECTRREIRRLQKIADNMMESCRYHSLCGVVSVCLILSIDKNAAAEKILYFCRWLTGECSKNVSNPFVEIFLSG